MTIVTQVDYIDGIKREFKFILGGIAAKRYLISDVVMRFSKEKRTEFLKQTRNKDFTVEFSKDNGLQKNMYNLIASEPEGIFPIKRKYLRGKKIKENLFLEIDKFIAEINPKKICIYIQLSNQSVLTIEDGHALRKHLKFTKEDSPIIFDWADEIAGAKDEVYLDIIAYTKNSI